MAIVLESAAGEEIFVSETNGGLTRSSIVGEVALPIVLSDWVSAGLMDPDELNAQLSFGHTAGNGLAGYDISVSQHLATGQLTVAVSLAAGGFGGSIEVSGTIGENGAFFPDLDSVDGFGGMQVIVGENGRLLGFSTGTAAKAQAGLFFSFDDTTGYDLGAGVKFNVTSGLIFGSLNPNIQHIVPIFHTDELSLDQVQQIVSELFPVTEGVFPSLFPGLTILSKYASRNQIIEEIDRHFFLQECFIAGTEIAMWPEKNDKTERRCKSNPDETPFKSKPIEEITPGDWVVSFDEYGKLKPGRVTRTFVKEAKVVLDFFGVGVTPGHVFYRADSKAQRKFETLIDILRDDGVIEMHDGTHIRASTGQTIDGPSDRFVLAVTGQKKPDGSIDVAETGKIRLGTRIILENGMDLSVQELIAAGGGEVDENGFVKIQDEAKPVYWAFGESLPKPEDYVLSRSGTTLAEICEAGEWSDSRPRLPMPARLDETPSPNRQGQNKSSCLPNVPLAQADHYADQPRPMLRGKGNPLLGHKQNATPRSSRQIVH